MGTGTAGVGLEAVGCEAACTAGVGWEVAGCDGVGC